MYVTVEEFVICKCCAVCVALPCCENWVENYAPTFRALANVFLSGEFGKKEAIDLKEV
jgi:hypothetical protein